MPLLTRAQSIKASTSSPSQLGKTEGSVELGHGQTKREVKEENIRVVPKVEVKGERDVKPKAEIKEERDMKPEIEVKEEQEAKPKLEVKAEDRELKQEFKEEGEKGQSEAVRGDASPLPDGPEPSENHDEPEPDNIPPTSATNRTMPPAPRRQFSAEILQRIFTMTVEGPKDKLVVPHLYRYTPWSLRQVSSSWRRAALAHRVLWSCMYIDAIDHEGEEDSLEAPVHDLDAKLLERFQVVENLLPKNGPVHVGLLYGNQDWPTPQRFTKHVLNAVSNRRCLRLTLQNRLLGFGEFFRMVREPSTIANLEYLELKCGHEDDEIQEPEEMEEMESTRGFSKAFKLKTLIIRSDFQELLDLALQKFDIPWKQLTNLVLGSGGSDPGAISLELPDVLRILKLSKQIEYCSLSRIEGGADDPRMKQIKAKSVTIPKLRSLVIQADDEAIYNYISMPLLEELEVQCSPHDFPSRAITSMLQRSPQLTALVHSKDERRPRGRSRSTDPPSIKRWEPLSRTCASLEVLECEPLLDKALIRGILSAKMFRKVGALSCSCSKEANPREYLEWLATELSGSIPRGTTRLRKVRLHFSDPHDAVKEQIEVESARLLSSHGVEVAILLPRANSQSLPGTTAYSYLPSV